MISIKKILNVCFVLFLSSNTFAQSEWYLSNPDYRNQLPQEVNDLIDPKIKLVVDDFNSFIDDWIKKSTAQYIVDRQFDRDCYNRALLTVQYEHQNQVVRDMLRDACTTKIYETRTEPRIIDKGFTKFSVIPTWEDVVETVQSERKLDQLGFSKESYSPEFFEIFESVKSIKFNLENNFVEVSYEFSGNNDVLNIFNFERYTSINEYIPSSLDYSSIYNLSNLSSAVYFADAFYVGPLDAEQRLASLSDVFEGNINNFFTDNDANQLTEARSKAIEKMSSIINQHIPKEVYNNLPHMVEIVRRQKIEDLMIWFERKIVSEITSADGDYISTIPSVRSEGRQMNLLDEKKLLNIAFNQYDLNSDKRYSSRSASGQILARMNKNANTPIDKEDIEYFRKSFLAKEANKQQYEFMILDHLFYFSIYHQIKNFDNYNPPITSQPLLDKIVDEKKSTFDDVLLVPGKSSVSPKEKYAFEETMKYNRISYSYDKSEIDTIMEMYEVAELEQLKIEVKYYYKYLRNAVLSKLVSLEEGEQNEENEKKEIFNKIKETINIDNLYYSKISEQIDFNELEYIPTAIETMPCPVELRFQPSMKKEKIDNNIFKILGCEEDFDFKIPSNVELDSGEYTFLLNVILQRKYSNKWGKSFGHVVFASIENGQTDTVLDELLLEVFSSKVFSLNTSEYFLFQIPASIQIP